MRSGNCSSRIARGKYEKYLFGKSMGIKYGCVYVVFLVSNVRVIMQLVRYFRKAKRAVWCLVCSGRILLGDCYV